MAKEMSKQQEFNQQIGIAKFFGICSLGFAGCGILCSVKDMEPLPKALTEAALYGASIFTGMCFGVAGAGALAIKEELEKEAYKDIWET